jgi:hypothetical protein
MLHASPDMRAADGLPGQSIRDASKGRTQAVRARGGIAFRQRFTARTAGPLTVGGLQMSLAERFHARFAHALLLLAGPVDLPLARLALPGRSRRGCGQAAQRHAAQRKQGARRDIALVVRRDTVSKSTPNIAIPRRPSPRASAAPAPYRSTLAESNRNQETRKRGAAPHAPLSGFRLSTTAGTPPLGASSRRCRGNPSR